MTVPADVMVRLIELERLSAEAAQRRDDAIQLVLLMLGAAAGSRIALQLDGTGQVQPPS